MKEIDGPKVHLLSTYAVDGHTVHLNEPLKMVELNS